MFCLWPGVRVPRAGCRVMRATVPCRPPPGSGERYNPVPVHSRPMSELFVLQTPLAELILRAAVICFFLLLVMWVIGRHEFGQLTPFDLILLLIISESISEALTAGDDSLLAGLVSASTLLGLSVLVSIGQYKSKRIRAIVSPEALKVIENGRIIEKSLRRELMTREDLIERLALFECSSSGRSVHRTPRKGYRWDREGTDRLHRERRRHIGAHL